MTSLHINDTKGCVLGFSFRNDSADVSVNTREFSGYNELVYKNETLRGVYFTNREDGTHGNIELKKIEKTKNKKNLLHGRVGTFLNLNHIIK